MNKKKLSRRFRFRFHLKSFLLSLVTASVFDLNPCSQAPMCGITRVAHFFFLFPTLRRGRDRRQGFKIQVSTSPILSDLIKRNKTQLRFVASTHPLPLTGIPLEEESRFSPGNFRRNR